MCKLNTPSADSLHPTQCYIYPGQVRFVFYTRIYKLMKMDWGKMRTNFIPLDISL